MSTVGRDHDNVVPRHVRIQLLALAHLATALNLDDDGTETARLVRRFIRSLSWNLSALGFRPTSDYLDAVADQINTAHDGRLGLVPTDRTELDRCLAEFVSSMRKLGVLAENGPVAS